MLHCFFVPALGIKTDATPGLINRINAFIQYEGVFHGQYSELHGTLHGLMPIAAEAVSPGTSVAPIFPGPPVRSMPALDVYSENSPNGPQSLA